MTLIHHKAILRLGFPLLVGQLGIIIMGFADTMMVGRFSTSALAAASFVNSVFNLITFLLMGYSYGLTPLISSLYARGMKTEAGTTFRVGIKANMLFAGLLFVLMGGLFFFLDRMGQPVELLPQIRVYYLCTLVSMLFVALFGVLRQFTDALTRTSLGMWTLLGGNALNILGNYLLIYGPGPFPRLGLLGAGLSTLLSRVVMSVMLCLIIFYGKRFREFLKQEKTRKSEPVSLSFINGKSLPIGLQMGMESGAFTFSGIMAGWLGAVDLATFQVVNTIGTLGFMCYYSFGAGMSIRIAAFFGQGDTERVGLTTRAGRHLLLGAAAVACFIFLLAGEGFIRLFSTDTAVISLAVSLIPPLILYQLGDAMQICYANALRATSQVKPMMYVAFVSYILVNIPAGYLLAFPLGMGIHGLYLAFSLGLFVAAGLFFYYYRRAVGV